MEILLDQSIRDWVLIPILVVVFLISLLKEFFTVLLQQKSASGIKLEDLKKQELLLRCLRFEKSHKSLDEKGFNRRRRFLINELKKYEQEGGGGLENAFSSMTDPSKMTGMLSKNMLNIVPNLLLYGFVSFFFSGIIVLKFPFSFPMKFKLMTQSGINIAHLPSSYVTSLSIYLLVLIALKGVFNLLLNRDVNVYQAATMFQPQQLMNFQQQNAMVKNQLKNLGLLKFNAKKCDLYQIEKRIVM